MIHDRFFRFRRSSLLLSLALFAPKAVAATPTSGPAAKFTIALFGDSVTRGVIADHTLGETLTKDDQDNLAKFQLIAPLYPYSPEGFGVLNYGLMGAFDFVARDHLAAVQGSQPYSVVSRLKAATGRGSELINLARLGGTYREADTQLAAYKTELAKRHLTTVDLVIVDFGRVDYSLFPTVEQFQKQVDAFFTKLYAISPNTRVLVTKIANEVQILNRPDRVALVIPDKGPISCRQMLGETITLGRSGINVGQDNTRLLPEALARYAGYNRVLQQAVDRLNQAGATAAITPILNERQNPEDWDKVFAYDCTHMNLAGQREIADHLYPVAAKILERPAATAAPKPVDTAESPLTAAGNTLWQDYLRSLPLDQLQPGCKPELLMPQDGVPYQGVVFLVHSFTGCPAELHDLADQMRTKGYAVVLPLLPGHGLKGREDALGGVKDDLSQLPLPRLLDQRNYRSEYNKLAATMDDLADEFSGSHAVVGYSLGAAVASAMTQLYPSRWDRQLLIDPFYQLNDGFQRATFGAILLTTQQDESWWATFAPLLGTRTSWGDRCEWQRQGFDYVHVGDPNGRSGYCQFTYGQALAASEFGFETWQLMQPTTIKTQVVGRADGSLANPELTFSGVGQMRNETLGLLPYSTDRRLNDHPDVRICYASADDDSWWQQPRWTDAFAGFLASAQPLAAVAEQVHGDPRCGLVP